MFASRTGELFFTLTAFELISDSELVFVGDAGSTEPAAGSKRYGLKLLCS